MVSAGFRPQLLAVVSEMGFRVALLDRVAPVENTLYDDFLSASPTNEESALEAAREYVRAGGRIDAVGSFFDGSIHVAAAICEEFGLPGNSREAVRNMRDKYRSWQVLSAAGLPVPRTEIARSEAEALEAGERLGYPLVMKPQASAASQGVIKVCDRDELLSAFKLITEMFELSSFGDGDETVPNIGQQLYYPDAREVLLQEYLDGFEVCVDLVYDEDSCELLGILDKPQVWAEPYFPELVFVTPSHLPEPTQHEIEDICVRSLRAIGATTGAAHIEFRITSAGPKIIEVNGRIGGPSLYVQETMQVSTGVWGPREYIKMVGGLKSKVERSAERRFTGFASVPVERQGRIVRFDGEEDVRAMPGVLDIRWAMKPGQFVPEGYPRNPSVMFAHVLATGESYDDLVATLEHAQMTLNAVME
jgi:biotin carboxylase